MKIPLPHRFPPLDQPAVYQIMVQGRLDEGWGEWFDGMTITAGKDETGQSVTILTGLVADQVTLHGLLARIRDLNLRILSVQRLDGSSGQVA
jgi:hypothetical protein